MPTAAPTSLTWAPTALPTSRAFEIVSIASIQYVAPDSHVFDSPLVGLDVNVTGTLTAVRGDKTGFWIQSDESKWSGIFVDTTYCPAGLCADVSSILEHLNVSISAIGDDTGPLLRVYGTVYENTNNTCIGDVARIEIVDDEVSLPAALVATTGAVGAGNYTSEAYEGLLVQFVTDVEFGTDSYYYFRTPGKALTFLVICTPQYATPAPSP